MVCAHQKHTMHFAMTARCVKVNTLREVLTATFNKALSVLKTNACPAEKSCTDVIHFKCFTSILISTKQLTKTVTLAKTFHWETTQAPVKA